MRSIVRADTSKGEAVTLPLLTVATDGRRLQLVRFPKCFSPSDRPDLHLVVYTPALDSDAADRIQRLMAVIN